MKQSVFINLKTQQLPIGLICMFNSWFISINMQSICLKLLMTHLCLYPAVWHYWSIKISCSDLNYSVSILCVQVYTAMLSKSNSSWGIISKYRNVNKKLKFIMWQECCVKPASLLFSVLLFRQRLTSTMLSEAELGKNRNETEYGKTQVCRVPLLGKRIWEYKNKFGWNGNLYA